MVAEKDPYTWSELWWIRTLPNLTNGEFNKESNLKVTGAGVAILERHSFCVCVCGWWWGVP